MATTTLSRKIGNQTLTFESGKMARLADGAVMVTYGETQVLGTCVSSNPREGIDFFPLTIDVEERMYAVGKIPGSFFRREGRPSRDGGPHVPADRPAAAPDVPRGLSRRGPGRHHRAGHGRREPVRHPRDERGLGRDVPGRAPVRRSGRLRSHGADRRTVGRSTRRSRRSRTRRSTSSSPAAATTSGVIDILMIEGEAPDNTWALLAIGRHGADRGGRRRGARGRQGRDRRADRVPAGVRGRGRRHREAVGAAPALRRRHLRGRVSAFAKDRLAEAIVPDKAEREEKLDALKAETKEHLASRAGR